MRLASRGEAACNSRWQRGGTGGRGKGKTLILGLVLVLGATTVVAQPVPLPPDMNQAPDVDPAEMSPDPEDIPERKLSREELVARAIVMRSEMVQALVQTKRLVVQAREHRDIIRVNCLLQKMAEIQVSLATADKALATIREETAIPAHYLALGPYRRVMAAKTAVQIATTEVEACVGEDLAMVAAFSVASDQGDTGSGGEFNDPGGAPGADFIRPSHATPYY